MLTVGPIAPITLCRVRACLPACLSAAAAAALVVVGCCFFFKLLLLPPFPKTRPPPKKGRKTRKKKRLMYISCSLGRSISTHQQTHARTRTHQASCPPSPACLLPTLSYTRLLAWGENGGLYRGKEEHRMKKKEKEWIETDSLPFPLFRRPPPSLFTTPFPPSPGPLSLSVRLLRGLGFGRLAVYFSFGLILCHSGLGARLGRPRDEARRAPPCSMSSVGPWMGFDCGGSVRMARDEAPPPTGTAPPLTKQRTTPHHTRQKEAHTHAKPSPPQLLA